MGAADRRMAEEGGKSKVVPVLVAALVCDVAVMDPTTGKKSLIGVFDRLNVGTFPTSHQMSLYLKVADAQGHYDIEVRFQKAGGTPIAGATMKLDAPDRLLSQDVYLAFPPLPIPEEGRYEFQVFANSIYLGAAFLDAVHRT